MSNKNKYSLFDMDGMSEVTNNLINKLFQSVGWVVMHPTPKKIATQQYIEDIKNKDYDPLTKAALISNAEKSIKEYSNQYNILQIAMQSLNENSHPEQVDEDWLSIFMDKTRLVSNNEFQNIWGKILATECNRCGSIPRSLLYVLSQMDREDAEAFTILCSLSINVEDDYTPFVVIRRFDEYKKWGINYDKMLNLSSLGLIEMDLGPLAIGYSIECDINPAKVKYYDNEYQFDNQNSVSVGGIIYTKTGQALFNAINVDKCETFWEDYVLPALTLENQFKS